MLGIQSVYREFEEWLANDNETVSPITVQSFKKVESKIEECLPYEESLVWF